MYSTFTTSLLQFEANVTLRRKVCTSVAFLKLTLDPNIIVFKARLLLYRFRGDFKKKKMCIFHDILQIKLLTPLPTLVMTKNIVTNCWSFFDPPFKNCDESFNVRGCIYAISISI